MYIYIVINYTTPSNTYCKTTCPITLAYWVMLAGVKLNHHKRTFPQCSAELPAYLTQNLIMLLSTKYARELQNGASWDHWDPCFNKPTCVALKSSASRTRSLLCKVEDATILIIVKILFQDKFSTLGYVHLEKRRMDKSMKSSDNCS